MQANKVFELMHMEFIRNVQADKRNCEKLTAEKLNG